MELPPSRSSSTSDCRSLCLPPLDGPDSPPTPDSVDAGSEASWRPASSSPCSLTEAPGVGLGLGLGMGLGLSPGVLMGSTSWREIAETEASLRRLLPTLDALLQQLDRVTMATEDLYHVECRLERAQRRSQCAGREKGGGAQGGWSEKGEDSAGWRERRSGKEKHKGSKKGKKREKSELPKDGGNPATNLKKTPAVTATPFLKPRSAPATTHTPTPESSKQSVSAQPLTPITDKPASDSSQMNTPPSHIPLPKTPTVPPCTPAPTPPPPSTPITLDWDPPTEREMPPSSSLFNHPAHTTTIPTRKRKRKPPPLKNKVHPNLDRHGPGHLKS